MLSTSIFSSNGSIYEQSAVFNSHFHLNQTALEVIGLPALTGSNVWSNLTSNLAVSLLENSLYQGLIIFPIDEIGGMIAHVVLFWGPYARDCVKLAYRNEQPDAHYQVSMGIILRTTPGQLSNLHVMQKYKENPWWWYVTLLCLSFVAGTPFKFFMQEFC